MPPGKAPTSGRNVDSTAILARLQQLHPKLIDLSLGRVRRLLGELGHPERRLPPVVHVAGTNGKGSTLACLRAILEAAGHRVHLYTSPHLVRFNERIRLAGREIDDRTLCDILQHCETANAGRAITLFEIATAAAFVAFARVPADVLLLEVGLGGRFDATNVIDRPLATAITPVSMDHMQYLGNSVSEIAFEKAGIVKPRIPVVVGRQQPAALAVIAERAGERAAPLHRLGTDFTARPDGGRLVFEMAGVSERLDIPALSGVHQLDNAAVALALATLIAPTVPSDEAARSRGMRTVSWPARLQHLKSGPLAELCAARACALWLDGGHNAEAGRAIAAMVADWRTRDADRPVALVVGMLNTKAATDYLAAFAGMVGDVRTVAIPGERASLSAAALAAAARAAGLRATAAGSVAEAVARAARAAVGGRVLIGGSLYLAGTILSGNR